ncbi:hypothetical protein B0H34DRAFT_860670 [Crassisporium funariophilum]|nr:hypothetical protein B0H34DRAFT_860670 [Crassisporium funariophilum]
MFVDYSTQDPSTYSERYRPLKDLPTLEAGAVHRFTNDQPPVFGDAISDYVGTYWTAGVPDVVRYLPRHPQHCGPLAPGLSSVVFSVEGAPGPYLGQWWSGVTLDGANDVDLVGDNIDFILKVDWPGFRFKGKKYSCTDRNSIPISRTAIADTVVKSIADIFMGSGELGEDVNRNPQDINAHTEQWNLKRIIWQDVRLISINFYEGNWVPVLAMSIGSDDPDYNNNRTH